jgi:hypothetical protein
MVTRSPADGSLIDKFLPNHDFRARYDIHISAPPSVVYQRLLAADFSDAGIVRLLMTLRTGKRMSRQRIPSDLRQRLQCTGFVILAEAPNEEIVIGVAGRFWRPDGGRCLNLAAGDFGDFSRLGYAKAAWNFKLVAESSAHTILSTETRIQCFGRVVFWKFRLYWSVVGPFSGLIRKAILNQVKAAAESASALLATACDGDYTGLGKRQ